MSTTRREFMRNVGITLAALLAGGCDLASWFSRNTTDGTTPNVPGITPQPVNNPPVVKTGFPIPTCYAPMPTLGPKPSATSTPRPAPTRVLPPMPTCYKPPEPTKAPAPPHSDKEHWQSIRTCWLELRESPIQISTESKFTDALLDQHRQACQALIQSETDPDIAQAIDLAFQHAIAHIRRQSSTCYVSIPAEYVPRHDLTSQIIALTEMSRQSRLQPDTVARVRHSLERDMAWLARFQKGNTLETQACPITPIEIEATRLLVELLLWKG